VLPNRPSEDVSLKLGEIAATEIWLTWDVDTWMIGEVVASFDYAYIEGWFIGKSESSLSINSPPKNS
jgi:hypothetical protein